MDSSFDPLAHPILFANPRTLSGGSAWTGHIPLGMLLIDLLRPNVLVELGTHGGDSYLAFCEAVMLLNSQTRCFAIDTWTGDEQTGFYGEEIFKWLRQQHDATYKGFSTLVQSTFDAARANFQDGQIDLLHIDGLHTYDAVKHDFETWLPKMSRRGVVLFHDIAVQKPGFGVHKLWDELSPRYSSYSVLHSFGLGILVVGNDPPPAMREFMQFARANTEPLRNMLATLGNRISLMSRIVSTGASLVMQGKLLAAHCIQRNIPFQFNLDLQAAYENPSGYADQLTRITKSLLENSAIQPKVQ
jgi:hypothetical protein